MPGAGRRMQKVVDRTDRERGEQTALAVQEPVRRPVRSRASGPARRRLSRYHVVLGVLVDRTEVIFGHARSTGKALSPAPAPVAVAVAVAVAVGTRHPHPDAPPPGVEPSAAMQERHLRLEPGSKERTHCSTCSYIGSLVACVGIATNTPPRPNLAARISAAASAAFVFPSPMGASATSKPGAGIDHARSTNSRCDARGCTPSRRVNGSSGSSGSERSASRREPSAAPTLPPHGAVQRRRRSQAGVRQTDEVAAVAGDPIRHHDQTRQGQLLGLPQRADRPHIRQALEADSTVKRPRPPAGPPPSSTPPLGPARRIKSCGRRKRPVVSGNQRPHPPGGLLVAPTRQPAAAATTPLRPRHDATACPGPPAAAPTSVPPPPPARPQPRPSTGTPGTPYRSRGCRTPT